MISASNFAAETVVTARRETTAIGAEAPNTCCGQAVAIGCGGPETRRRAMFRSDFMRGTVQLGILHLGWTATINALI